MPRLILLFVLLLSAAAAHAERVALVIGNATYQSGPLRNPTNDATDVATKLRGLGFQVIAGNNLDREGMVRKVQEFRAALKPGGLGLFFYSGHGVEVGGTNYLLPVNNGGIRTIEDVEIYGLEAQRLVRQMEASGTQLNVVILDACRDNPLPAMVRSASKGLGRMDAQQGTLIAYATREGQVAADGAGRNSPYTSALLRYLGEPGLEVAQLFNQVGLEVSTATSGVQVPWVSSSPVPRVMLAGVGQVAQPVANLPPGEGEVRIQVSPPNATVRIDGALVGSGSRTLRQAAGKTLTVRAEAEGFEPLEEQVMVLGGQSADVVLRLAPVAAAQPPASAGNVPAPALTAPSVQGSGAVRSLADAQALGVELTEGQKALLSRGNFQFRHSGQTVSGTPSVPARSAQEWIGLNLGRLGNASYVSNVSQYAPTATGAYTPIKMREEFLIDGSAAYFFQIVDAPSRLAGNILLVHVPLRETGWPQQAWVYNPGQARVRKAPNVAFDNPGTASDGLRTNDMYWMFWGSMERFDWQVGDAMWALVPATERPLAAADLRPGAPSPDVLEYAIRPVVKIEARIGAGQRHINHRRTFYVDIENGQIRMVDHYDTSAQLWRYSEAHGTFRNDASSFVTQFHVDFKSSRYIVSVLDSWSPANFNAGQFSPQNLRSRASQ